jgi:CheY-like chemotaxis protein
LHPAPPAIRGEPFFLVFLDLMVPEFDGCVLAVRLRRDHHLDNFASIVLSSVASRDGGVVPVRVSETRPPLHFFPVDDRRECHVEVGMDGYLPEPLRFRVLNALMNGIGGMVSVDNETWADSVCSNSTLNTIVVLAVADGRICAREDLRKRMTPAMATCVTGQLLSMSGQKQDLANGNGIGGG